MVCQNDVVMISDWAVRAELASFAVVIEDEAGGTIEADANGSIAAEGRAAVTVRHQPHSL